MNQPLVSRAPPKSWIGPPSGQYSFGLTYWKLTTTFIGTPASGTATVGRIYYMPCVGMQGLPINRLGIQRGAAPIAGMARFAIAQDVGGVPGGNWIVAPNTEADTSGVADSIVGVDCGNIVLPPLCWIALWFSTAAVIHGQSSAGNPGMQIGGVSIKDFIRSLQVTSAYSTWPSTPPAPTAFMVSGFMPIVGGWKV